MAALPLLPIAIGLSAAGTALSVVGAIRSSQAQSAAADYNAKIASMNAQAATQQGEAAAEAQQRDSARKIGASLAAFGASGVQTDTGSPADVLAQSARDATLDNLSIKYNAKMRALGYQAQSGLDSASASNSSSAGILSGTAALLSGAGSAAGMYYAGTRPTPATGTPSMG